MTILRRWEQQPADRIDYAFDYANGEPPFLENGDTLVSATIAVEPDGLNVSEAPVLDGQARFWVSGGESGKKYKVTCTARTRLGRVKQDEVVFTIKEI